MENIKGMGGYSQVLLSPASSGEAVVGNENSDGGRRDGCMQPNVVSPLAGGGSFTGVIRALLILMCGEGEIFCQGCHGD